MARMKTIALTATTILALAALTAADAAWTWSGNFGDRAVEMLIVGDIQIHSRRADPSTAFNRMRDTLKKADLVYANLEGLLVTSAGAKNDIPDKPEWTHPGPGGAKTLKASNITVVGVANNVASGRANILKSLAVLDANGITHTGAGRNIDEAHQPAIVERKGVKIGFLQYTARWYQDKDMIATPSEAGVAKIASLDGITIDPADLDRVKADIKKLRPLVDIIVVSHHNRDGSTPVQFGAVKGTSAGRDRSKSEEYQRQFAHTALDTGAISSSAMARTPSRASRSTTANRFSTRSATPTSISRDTRNQSMAWWRGSSFKASTSAASRSCRCRATATTTSTCSIPTKATVPSSCSGSKTGRSRRRHCASTGRKSCCWKTRRRGPTANSDSRSRTRSARRSRAGPGTQSSTGCMDTCPPCGPCSR
jgi:hypothetical protein